MFSFPTRHTVSGLFETIRGFESWRLHFWQSSCTWMVFAPIGTSFRLLSRACQRASSAAQHWLLCQGEPGFVGEAKLNVGRIKMGEACKPFRSPALQFSSQTFVAWGSHRKCAKGLPLASKSAATVGTVCVPQHDNKNRPHSCNVSHLTNPGIFVGCDNFHSLCLWGKTCFCNQEIYHR